MNKLSDKFYQRDDVLEISRQLLGKFLLTCIDNVVTGGMIIETEAYRGPEDRASHAYNMKRTPRNEMMYRQGGCSYVYMCYGIHSLFNVVTSIENIPHAVLIRAIKPFVGIEMMIYRRKKSSLESLTSGPGTLSQALGITKAENGLLLTGNRVWIEDRSYIIPEDKIIASPRIGIEYAKEDALLPWRFRINP